MGYPSGKILLASTEVYENELPVVLSVFQVCLQKKKSFNFNLKTKVEARRSPRPRRSLCHPP